MEHPRQGPLIHPHHRGKGNGVSARTCRVLLVQQLLHRNDGTCGVVQMRFVIRNRVLAAACVLVALVATIKALRGLRGQKVASDLRAGSSCAASSDWHVRLPSGHPDPASILPERWMSQDSQDWFAWINYFYGRRDVLMLESGAYDGVLFSNSLGPVIRLGWRAIHVESGLSNFALLNSSRPESINIHAALCDREAVVHVTNKGHAVSTEVAARGQNDIVATPTCRVMESSNG